MVRQFALAARTIHLALRIRYAVITNVRAGHLRRVLTVFKPSAALTSLLLLVVVVLALLPETPPADTVTRVIPMGQPVENTEPSALIAQYAGEVKMPSDHGRELPHSFIGENYATDITYEVPHTRFGGYGTRFAAHRIPNGKLIYVDVARQRTWCIEDRKVVAYFVISTGVEDTPTPPGDYEIKFKIPYAVSRDFYENDEKRWWGLPYYMDIGGYGFHAVPSLYMRHREPFETLGRPASHRCIRLGHVVLESLGNKSPARWLFEWTEIGTPVQIRGEWNFSDPPQSRDLECRRFSPELGFYLEPEDSCHPNNLVSSISMEDADS